MSQDWVSKLISFNESYSPHCCEWSTLGSEIYDKASILLEIVGDAFDWIVYASPTATRLNLTMRPLRIWSTGWLTTRGELLDRFKQYHSTWFNLQFCYKQYVGRVAANKYLLWLRANIKTGLKFVQPDMGANGQKSTRPVSIRVLSVRNLGSRSICFGDRDQYGTVHCFIYIHTSDGNSSPFQSIFC